MTGEPTGKDERRAQGTAEHDDTISDETIASDDAVAPDDTIPMVSAVTPNPAVATGATVALKKAGAPVQTSSTAARDGGATPCTEGAESADLDELPTIDPTLYARGAEIARGGMGRIVQARDRKLGRNLAIKELLSPTPELEKRFEREMKITARLQHPAIIAVHDAGRWPSGDAFYTMKHVDGKALDEVIDETSTLRDRLALLPTVLAVADALAYAHAEGVIHRDLKPGNILVGSFGETVVIDWGLAKQLGNATPEQPVASAPSSTADDVLTVLGQAMGTPSYMPPEQASGKLLDQRADVYAIGAILYHVLSGQRPYADTAPMNAHALLFAVAEQAPTDLAEIADHIPPDLLTIVAKAMARDASDRYPTAGELAEDLRRYQTGQLVGAHDYSSWALLKRWIGRHRAAVTVATVMALVLAVGAAVSFRRIASERDRAEEHKALAEDNRSEVEGLLDFMLVDLRDRLKPIGQVPLLELVANKADDYYRSRPVDWQRPRDPGNRARALLNLGDVQHAQGNLAAALASYQESRAILAKVTAKDPSNPTWQNQISVNRDRTGDVLRDRGDLPAALAEFRASLAIRARLAASDPDNATWQHNLSINHDKVGEVLQLSGDLPAAAAAYRAGLAIREGLATSDPGNAAWQRDLSLSHTRIGAVHKSQGDLAAALAEFRTAQSTAEQMVASDPTNTTWQSDLCVCDNNVGEVLLEQGELGAALVEFRKILDIRARLAASDPSNATWQRDLAFSHEQVGAVLHAQGDLGAALTACRASLAINQQLTARDPTNASWQRGLAISHEGLGNVLHTQGDLAAALTAHQDSQTINAQLATRDPSNASWRHALSVSHNNVGNVHKDQGDLGAALASFRAGLAILEELTASDPTNAEWQRGLAISHLNVGTILQRMNPGEAAREHLARAGAIYESSATDAGEFYNSACMYAQTGNPDKAFDMLGKAASLGFRDDAWAAKDSDLAPLRTDPRWQPLIERMKANK